MWGITLHFPAFFREIPCCVDGFFLVISRLRRNHLANENKMNRMEPTPSRSRLMAEDPSRLEMISTRWTLLEQAHRGTDGAAAARTHLLERYGGAVRRYLRGA